MKRIVVALSLAAAVAVMPAARAQTTTQTSMIEEAAEALQSNPVYVAPSAAGAVSDAEAHELGERIAEADAGPVYIAVLPDRARLEAGGSTTEVAESIARGVGESGTYVVVVGTGLRAGTVGETPFEPGTVPALADEAVEATRGEGAAAVLLDLVGRLEEAAADGGGSGSDGGGSGSSGFGLLPLLLIAGVGAFAFSRIRGRRRERQEAAAHFDEVREVATEDLVALGEDLRALDLDVEMPGANPDAKRHYAKALECYERASTALDRARSTEELTAVSSALEEGRYAIAATRARLEGRGLPERRLPCFFDPRHGPSVRDVEWAPPDGAPRLVPACADDARRVEEGSDPRAREITVGGDRRPYWDAPYYYGPWAGGYFGGFGLFEGMLLGSLLSGGWGGGYEPSPETGGDFGGGDFGGDFGGGDFGGGDFGGGDFGG